jgi:hypothetical protein
MKRSAFGLLCAGAGVIAISYHLPLLPAPYFAVISLGLFVGYGLLGYGIGGIIAKLFKRFVCKDKSCDCGCCAPKTGSCG